MTKKEEKYMKDLQDLSILKNATLSLISLYSYDEETEENVNNQIDKFNESKREFEEKYNVEVDSPDLAYVGKKHEQQVIEVKKDEEKTIKVEPKPKKHSQQAHKQKEEEKQVSKEMTMDKMREYLKESVAIARESAECLAKQEEENKKLRKDMQTALNDQRLAILALCEACKVVAKHYPNKTAKNWVLHYLEVVRKKAINEKPEE